MQLLLEIKERQFTQKVQEMKKLHKEHTEVLERIGHIKGIVIRNMALRDNAESALAEKTSQLHASQLELEVVRSELKSRENTAVAVPATVLEQKCPSCLFNTIELSTQSIGLVHSSKCGHVMCETCYKRWRKEQKKIRRFDDEQSAGVRGVSCPCCRQKSVFKRIIWT